MSNVLNVLSDYMKEMQNMDSYFTDNGFAFYQISPENKELYIEAMSMDKSCTKKEINDFLEVIFNRARNVGCTIVTGNVNVTKERATSRILSHIRRGYKVVGNNGDYISFYKEI